jgi:hypothetical protein
VVITGYLRATSASRSATTAVSARAKGLSIHHVSVAPGMTAISLGRRPARTPSSIACQSRMRPA